MEISEKRPKNKGEIKFFLLSGICVCVQVIEVLVRSEQGLFREVVKHLNQVEEQVLESLAWTSDSPLWESLRGAKDHVPTCQEVSQHKDTLYTLMQKRLHFITCICLNILLVLFNIKLTAHLSLYCSHRIKQ